MTIVMMESSLATSEIFKKALNDPEEGQTPLLQQVKEYILDPNTKHLTEQDLEAQFITLKQTVDPLTHKALEAFNNEDIILLNNNGNKNKSIVKALPFITLKSKGKNVTYIFMDSFIKISRGNMMSISTADLRDLMVGALISTELHNNYNRLANSESIKSIMMEIYMKLFVNILNRQYSLMANKQMVENIQYWVNRFFLTKIFGGNDSPEAVDALAKKYFKLTTELQAADYKRMYDEADPQNVTGLLELIKSLSTRMDGESTYRFLNDWYKYYNIASLLAIDDIEYLIFMTLSSYSGNGNIINIGASTFINEVKNIKNLRSELVRIV